jgi:hypothetical protein
MPSKQYLRNKSTAAFHPRDGIVEPDTIGRVGTTLVQHRIQRLLLAVHLRTAPPSLDKERGKNMERVAVAVRTSKNVEEERDKTNSSRNVAPISRDWWGTGDSDWLGSPLWVAH